MENNTEMLIYEMALRVRLFRMLTGSGDNLGNLSDREMLILELLNMKDDMSISEIAALCPSVSGSTISTTITKLWKDDKLVSKTILPENQRVTMVSLTPEGKKFVEDIRRAKSELYLTIAESMNLSPEEGEIFNKILKNAIRFFDERLNIEKGG